VKCAQTDQNIFGVKQSCFGVTGPGKKIELQFTVIKSEEEEEKPREGSSDQTVLF
jgi:hypothetical protein